MLMYNVLLRWRHRLPVRSVAVLLRPQAQGSGISGAVAEVDEPDQRLDFRYRLIRLWEHSPDLLLQGGLGTLPLAPIAKITEDNVAKVIESIQQRLLQHATAGEEADTWAATLVLLGLRYSQEMGRSLLRGVSRMRESTTYQAILEEGRAEEARALLRRLGKKRFGAPPSAIAAKLDEIIDLSRLELLAERVYDTSSWDELLNG